MNTTHAHIPRENNPAENHKATASPTDILYPNLQPRTKQHPTDTQPTFSRSPKPTNDEQPTTQNTGRCCHHARTSGSRHKRKSCPLAAPKSKTKNAMDAGVAKVGLPSSTIQLGRPSMARPFLLGFLDPKMMDTGEVLGSVVKKQPFLRCHFQLL